MRITVPFGRNNIKRHGVIVKLFYGMNSQLKEICAVDKKTNPLSEEMVSLAFMAKRTLLLFHLRVFEADASARYR